MVLYFNKRDLVKFGNYLGSEERKQLFKTHPEFGEQHLEERLSQVHNSDIENWLASLK